MPDDHGALEVAMGLWTDADFLAIAEAQARAAADAGAQQDRRGVPMPVVVL